MPPIEKPPVMEQTEYGWAFVSEKMPARGEANIWMKIPERHVYLWDGDGYYRAQPKELLFIPIKHA